MAAFSIILAVFLLLGQGSASIQDHCTDISYWDEIRYETTTKQCCDTKLHQVCTTKRDQICQDVLELQCEVVAWGECQSTPTSTRSTKCIVKYNDFAHQNCEEVTTSVAHTKKVPECKEITKNNCVTDWDHDSNGNKVWAGTETCTPVTWEDCDIVEKTVEFPTVKTECGVDSHIKWTELVDVTTNIVGVESKCEVKKAVNCKHVVANKCAPVVWDECKMEPREECLAVVIHTPIQEKIHQKKCLTGHNTAHLNQPRPRNQLLQNDRKEIETCLSSPGFPDDYPDNQNTVQSLEVPAGQNIHVNFLQFDLEGSSFSSCYDYVEFLDASGDRVGAKLCGDSLPQPITIESSTAKVIFASDGSVTKKGFKLCYSYYSDPCPLGWTSLPIGCYRFLKSETFEEAKSNCKNEGGLLVGDNSLYKQAELSTFYKNSGISGEVWLGATYSAKEGEWKWINNNQPMTFNSWNLGEPNNLGNENCVVWDGEESWNDVPCDKIKKNTHSLCEYPGNWGQWSSWSEVDTCSKRCGGGKQRVKKLRSCNSPIGCRGESRKIIERDCNTHACTCINEGRVADFCIIFPQEIRSEEKRQFCTFDIEEKREALLCDQISSKIAVDLLNIVSERLKPEDCNYDPTEVLDGDCGQLLRDKVSKSCDDKTCQAKKTEAQRKIDEVIEKTDEAYEEQIEFQEYVENLILRQKELLQHANKYKEHDDKRIEIKIKQKEIMKKVVKNLEDNAKLSQDAKQKLKVKAWDKLKEKTLSQTKIETVNIDLMSVREKKERLKDGHTNAKNQFGKAKKNLVANKAIYFQKTTVAMGHILKSIKKIKKGDALNVIGGVLDIAAGIGEFLPPPTGIITGTISTIFSMFQGEGAPTLASTQLVIKNQFKKQREWMEEKFDEVDKQFHSLSYDIKKGFGEIDNKLKKHFRDLKKEIEQKFEKQTDILLMKAVTDKTRDARSQWHKLARKLAFITDQENIRHSEASHELITDKMINFGDESKIYEFRDFVKDECKAKSGLEIREYCQVLALATLMMDRANEIIITKTMALIATSSLKTLDFTNTLEERKMGAYEFFTEIFTSTKEEKFSYISCGLSDRSHAKLSDEQKNNLLDYAEHLDPSLGLTKKLEQRESCVDGSYGKQWLPVKGDDITFKKKIEECCKKGKKTEKRTCFPPKNGGVDCDPSVLHLRCEGFLSVGYCPAFIRSEKGKYCKGDNHENVLEEFETETETENDAIKSRDRCEEYCSKNDDCWGCSVQFTDRLNYKWNALTQCKSIAVFDGKIEGDITRKPGNDIIIPGTVLLEGEFITSPNGENQLLMQDDGNLVLYRKKSWIWASHTEQKCSGCIFHFEIDDGISYHLLLKDNTNTRVWRYPKLSVGADALELKDDGTLVLTKKLHYIDHINKVFIETKTANITFESPPNTNFWGEWGKTERCPFPYFINKMDLKIEASGRGTMAYYIPDDTALNAIRLTCSIGTINTLSSEQWSSWAEVKECIGGRGRFITTKEPEDDETSTYGRRFECTITSSKEQWGTWRGVKACPEGSFIKKAKIERAPARKGDNTAAESIKFGCTDGSEHHPGKYALGFGTWSGWSSCEDGSVVYGIRTRVEAADPDDKDKTALNDVIFLCGELPVDKYYIETPRITFPDDEDYWGDWGDVERCPFPHFANKMELKIEEQQSWGVDDTALNGIRLTCTDGTPITSSTAQWGSWRKVKACPEGTIKRTKLRREKPTPGDETSANGIRFECTDGSSHEPGDGYWGSWSEWSSCGDGSAVYGIQTRVEAPGGDDTALNDVRFFCASIINPTG